MKFTPALLSAACLVLGSPVPRDLPSGVVAVGIERVAAQQQTVKLGARGLYTEPLSPVGHSEYQATIQIGTPPQTVQTQIDTGSADLSVRGAGGAAGESFDGSKSSTYRLLQAGGFGITYGSGSARGDFVADTVSAGGAAVQQQQFAVVNSGDDTSNVFGIGLVGGEATWWEQYPNFPQSLRNTGLVAKNAYSLYLNSYDADEGTLLFGGIDTAKFSGKLHKSPTTISGRLAVHSEFQGESFDSTLDSGATWSYIPDDLFDAYLQKLKQVAPGVTLQSDLAWFSGSIDTIPASTTWTINLGGTNFDVPLRSLFGQWAGQDNIWVFGFQKASVVSQTNPLNVYGDNVLRNFYVVYDLEDLSIAIAPAVSTTKSSVVAIGPEGIPANLLA